VLLGNGDGTFRAVVNYGVGDRPNSVAIGDLNGDGNKDLATANVNGDNISVLIHLPERCIDNDGDGYGDPANTNCDHPELDCDDDNPNVNPGATEGPPEDLTCSDTLDNDCDGNIDLSDRGCVPYIDMSFIYNLLLLY